MKVCHSDTNHGDLKRSGKLAEHGDSADRSIVAGWPRGTSGVQRHSSISWSRSLGTSNCLGTPLFLCLPPPPTSTVNAVDMGRNNT